MLQNYMFFNGEKYKSGTVFIVNCLGKESEAIFIGYNAEHESYFFKINNKTCRMKETVFKNSCIRVTNKVNTDVYIPKEKKRKELEVGCLFLGWIWYIFLMAIATIFNGAIFIWIMISIAFFSWRAKKIKEEGMYVEW